MKYTEFFGRFFIGGWLAISAYLRYMNLQANITIGKDSYVNLHKIITSYFGINPHVSMEVLIPIVTTIATMIAVLEALTSVMILIRSQLYPLILAIILMIESIILYHEIFYIKEFRVQYFETVLFNLILVGILFMLSEKRKDSEYYQKKQAEYEEEPRSQRKITRKQKNKRDQK